MKLKAINAYRLTTNTEDSDVYIHNDEFGCGGDLVECYLKSEADKVITELEDNLRAANEQIENLINSASSIMLFQDRVNDNMYAELRHHKFKRCLAMARWCMTEYLHSKCLDFTNTEQWYWRRWHIRWRNLAKKFKEAK